MEALTMEAQRFLNTREAAEFLGVKERMLTNMRHFSRGPAYLKVSNKFVRYSIEDLKAYMAAHRVEPGGDR
jgi:predicted DNA-binding transcriptional regulator AlpA